ncbi:DUF7344 domain-containing protein [Natrarchaeobaculum aegyptiacum]|uniref:DUF7344 domain-containing protein n=1 Tax=Natrarchaeobaculum aegyptiacum TaxID=745377 RepID=A0A2Z2HTH1_9EURY|nr:hypothetical protein [Natrarchaeobaculum aegyptiacum]ARS89425.1 hypothetical protein B1756_06470 [Natrarchaeobaculum aegyptiacum]
MESLASRSGGRQLSADTILELLANRRRRYLLYALRGREDPIELSTLAEQIAGWEHDVPPDEVAKNEYKSVYVSSVQCHVPKLADAGVVDHDEDNHTVVLGDNFDQLEPYLRVVVQDEPENSTLHAALEDDSSDGFISQLKENVARLKH